MRRPDLGFIGTLVRRDVSARLSDRWPLILWIAIPLVIGGMITAVGGGAGGPKPVARLLLVDQDQSLISGLLGGAFNQGPLAGLVQVEQLAEDEARRRLDAGEGSAMLVIPKDFGDAVLQERATELLLLTNPAQRILPSIVEGILGVIVDGVFYLQRVLGPEIQIIAGFPAGGSSDASIAAVSVAINQAVNEAQQLLVPPVIEVAFEGGPGEQAGPGFGILFFPGIVLMALLFAAQSMADDLWKEREAGTLRRLAVTPQPLGGLLVAKALSVMLLLAGVATIILLIGFLYYGLSFWRLPLSLLWLSVGGVFLFALFSLIAIAVPSRSAASVLTTALVFPLLMVGGSFFPFEAMPGWLAGVGRWLPNGYLLSQFKSYLLGRSGALDLAVGFLFLVPVSAALLGLCRWRLPRFARQ